MAMLVVFYQTLDDEVPKWLNSNGIIGDNPGKLTRIFLTFFVNCLAHSVTERVTM
jgi:hypothetical protein